MTPIDLDVAMIDPSRMTPLYDASLCSALAEAGVRLQIHEREKRDGEPTVELTIETGQRFYRFTELLRRRFGPLVAKLLKPIEHIWDMARLYRRLRSDRPDIIHLQWAVVPVVDLVFIKVAQRYIAPVVLTVHDTNPLHGVSALSVQRLGIGRCISAASALVVHANFSLQNLPERRSTEVEVIPLAVDPVPQDTADPDGTFRILMFGRLRHYKGIDILIKSLAHLRSDVRDRTTVLVAGSPLMEVAPLKDLAASLGVDDLIEWKLEFLTDEQTHAAFFEADVLAMPYRDIDGSGVMAQAFGYGTPVVATRLGGFTEQVTHEQTALLIEPESPHELATALERLADDPELAARIREALVAAGRTMTWANAAESNICLYRRVIKGSTRQ